MSSRSKSSKYSTTYTKSKDFYKIKTNNGKNKLTKGQIYAIELIVRGDLMCNLIYQPSLDKLIVLLCEKFKEAIAQKKLAAMIWIVGGGAMSTLSFRNEKPTLIIHKNIHDLPFDSSGMELIAKSDNIASIQIDLNNLDLYKCILIDPREELLDFPTLRNHLIGVS